MNRSTAILPVMMGLGVLLTADDATGRPFAAGRGMAFHPGIAAAPRPLAVAPRAGFHARSRGHLHAQRIRNRASGFGLWPWYDGYYPSDSYAPSAVPPYMPYEEPGAIPAATRKSNGCPGKRGRKKP
jgi:hypothetical protein